MNLVFTQEIKDNWIEALESGKFTQGYCALQSDINPVISTFCCIGVLGHITEGLNNNTSANDSSNPYCVLQNSGIDVDPIWKKNDQYSSEKKSRPKDYKDDYSNVLEIIKSLPVREPLK